MFEDTVLSWPEAEIAFRDRLAIDSEEFYALSQELRGTAWTITRITEYQTMLRAQRKLHQLIAEGGTLQEFIKWAKQGQAVVWSDAYTELIFRMATLGSYSKARWDEINDPDVAGEFELIMYDAVNDDRTRDEHGALDGMTWPLNEFPGEWWPPNGFNCRCETRNMNEDLRRRAGGKIQDGPAPGEPDKGFQSNQALDWNEQLTRELAELRGELGA
jgi:SPP1 gp7 family putative phage head morphogenesis protein